MQMSHYIRIDVLIGGHLMLENVPHRCLVTYKQMCYWTLLTNVMLSNVLLTDVRQHAAVAQWLQLVKTWRMLSAYKTVCDTNMHVIFYVNQMCYLCFAPGTLVKYCNPDMSDASCQGNSP